MLVYMVGRVCNPQYILHAGEVYNLPAKIAKDLLKQRMVEGYKKIGDNPDPNQPVFGGPIAEVYDPRKHGKKKKWPLQVPSKPDPLDGVDPDEIEDDEDDEPDEPEEEDGE